MNEKCWTCEEKAEWVRCTQFAGDHFFCRKCAELEDGFNIYLMDKSNRLQSCEYWVTVENYG